MKIKIFALMLSVLMLCGCGVYAPYEMFESPQIPQQYNNLMRAVTQIRNSGFEYAEPVSGLNRQPLQLMDLDGDGIDEGIALLRDVNDTYKVFLYIFRQKDGAVELLDSVEGEDNTVYSVSYSNVLNNGNFEMIIEWGTESADTRPVTVYSIAEGKIEKELEITSARFAVSDIDQNGENDFCAVTGKPGERRCDIYNASISYVFKKATIPLSPSAEKVTRIKAGGVAEGQNGMFIESLTKDGGTVTDIITFEDGKFISAIPNGIYSGVRASCEDVNNDKIIEIPMASYAAQQGDKTADLNQCYNWSVYSSGGKLSRTAFTYHSYVENWYMAMPLSWSGSIEVKRNARRPGQIALMFSSVTQNPIPEDASGSASEYTSTPLFTVFILTGEMRKQVAASENRFIIHEREDTIFAAEIYVQNYLGSAINPEFIKDAFKIRESEWISNDLFA